MAHVREQPRSREPACLRSGSPLCRRLRNGLALSFLSLPLAFPSLPARDWTRCTLRVAQLRSTGLHPRSRHLCGPPCPHLGNGLGGCAQPAWLRSQGSSEPLAWPVREAGGTRGKQCANRACACRPHTPGVCEGRLLECVWGPRPSQPLEPHDAGGAHHFSAQSLCFLICTVRCRCPPHSLKHSTSSRSGDHVRMIGPMSSPHVPQVPILDDSILQVPLILTLAT